MDLNQEHLETQISELEKGYVISKIELIKIPVYNKSIKKDLDKVTKELDGDLTDNDRTKKTNRQKALKETLALNVKNKDGHNESLDNVEQILNKVYKLRK